MKSVYTYSKALIAAAAIALTATSAQAFIGEVNFSQAEKARHLSGLNTILQTAAGCLNYKVEDNRQFYQRYGISKYFGNQSEFYKMSRGQRRNAVAAFGLPGELADQMLPTSCVDLALDCLRDGFEAAGQSDLFARIEGYVVDNDKDSTSLQNGLRQIGWKVVYWNPDLSMNESWDAEESRMDNSDHYWGYHSYRWTMLQRTGKYYTNPVDDTTSLVNFGASRPAYLSNIPFWVGSAHTGYHTFPGTYSNVVEGHSARDLDDPRAIQTEPFNPMGGEGPDGPYRTGIIAVPPGY